MAVGVVPAGLCPSVSFAQYDAGRDSVPFSTGSGRPSRLVLGPGAWATLLLSTHGLPSQRNGELSHGVHDLPKSGFCVFLGC